MTASCSVFIGCLGVCICIDIGIGIGIAIELYFSVRDGKIYIGVFGLQFFVNI
jgi:hypothetical protein